MSNTDVGLIYLFVIEKRPNFPCSTDKEENLDFDWIELKAVGVIG